MTSSNPQSQDRSRGVVILGSTGSIGMNTLDVLARHSTCFHVAALTANRQVDVIFEQCRRFRPQLAVMLDAASAERLAERVRAAGLTTEIVAGPEGLEAAAILAGADTVVTAIVGAAGLLPTLAAVRAGKRVLLANKEPLVIGGRLLIEAARTHGAQLLPIDSEHNAIFQCLPNNFSAGAAPPGVRRLLLTCSGGPFRTLPAERLGRVTPEEACAHPNWVMGRKISVDSATLMNKGLELIEACRFFGMSPQQVEIVIHPQSVVHSMVEYRDGSVLAQLSNPDMRIPIAHALAWPERIDSGARAIDLLEMAQLDFSAPDRDRFPCLDLAYEAAATGGTAPAILNAANEVAVEAFLDRRIGFTDIAGIIAGVLSEVTPGSDETLAQILGDDARARYAAGELIERRTPRRQQGTI
ncbi:MAG: 1-deoxy-D-xylulose-5-phosphate reductoisomerase [Candidatus Muproteobacteria bacterium RBG_16_60_9]|uniref:1-deoxy-D-xylulose 5-phosphate reductoisomerase n=1 Tax=Candidatus Muproteobacteria bacterium RBG_16_60_9 TaxID=1817755 RepID=A0A1F6UX84_9PROT|nr:MAG: 1-deoxy-D-xylulose-5-phosphate reductoisomerase [Candidatus Muproteobacteria bacterium RBG_16_60_9]